MIGGGIGSGLTLVTGETGGGKTALVVKWLTGVKDRPIYVMGVPELKVEHFKVPPVDDWTELRPDPDDGSKMLPFFTFPPNAVVWLDEGQRIFRPRQVGSKVPDVVAAFETRRHTGMDFVVSTQHPSFLDVNIRKLVTRHVHIHNTFFGRYLLEWKKTGDPDEASSRDLARRERYKLPKEVFNLYKSAEVHTKPLVRRPWLVYAFPVMFMALIGGGIFVYQRIQDKMSPVEQSQTVASSGSSKNSVQDPERLKAKSMTRVEYLALYTPRIAELPHTAPAYDELTKAKVVPEPVGCMESKRTGCKCYTQQGTPYETTESVCRNIMASGLWMPWKDPVAIQSAPSVSGAKQDMLPPVGVLPASTGMSPSRSNNASLPTKSASPVDKS